MLVATYRGDLSSAGSASVTNWRLEEGSVRWYVKLNNSTHEGEICFTPGALRLTLDILIDGIAISLPCI